MGALVEISLSVVRASVHLAKSLGQSASYDVGISRTVAKVSALTPGQSRRREDLGLTREGPGLFTESICPSAVCRRRFGIGWRAEHVAGSWCCSGSIEELAVKRLCRFPDRILTRS